MNKLPTIIKTHQRSSKTIKTVPTIMNHIKIQQQSWPSYNESSKHINVHQKIIKTLPKLTKTTNNSLSPPEMPQHATESLLTSACSQPRQNRVRFDHGLRLLIKIGSGVVPPFGNKFRRHPVKLSSRTTADLHQPQPFRATAAVCRRGPHSVAWRTK